MIKHPYPDDDRKKFLSSFANINQMEPFGVVFSKLLMIILGSFYGRGDLTIKGKHKKTSPI